MSDPTRKLEDLIQAHLRQSDYDLLEMVPLPAHGDRMVRLRTLQEILDDFESAGEEGAIGYVLQIKPSRPAPHPAPPSFADTDEQLRKPASDPIYLGEGKLNIPYLMRSAELLYNVGDFALARNLYKAVIDSGEHAAPALFGMGRCLHAEGKTDAARAAFEESLAYQPALECYRQLGSLLMAEGRHAQAAEILERALSMRELAVSTRFELCKAAGNCWARAGKAEQAEKLYARALEINPSADEIRANLGALHLSVGRTAEAHRHFNDALASNPRNAKALAGLGSCSLGAGDKRSAHDFFASSLELELKNADAIFHLVKLAYELKNHAPAARILAEYVQVAPVNANLLYSLAGLQFHLGQIDEASATVAQALSIQPEHAAAAELKRMIERLGGRNPPIN